MRKEIDHRCLNPKYTVWKAFMLYSKQHLIICPQFKHTRWRIDISNSSECSCGILQDQHLLGGPCLSFPRVEKAKKIDHWGNILEARMPETRGGILNCYCIIFYTEPHGSCSEWPEYTWSWSDLTLCRKWDYSRYAPSVRDATADITRG